MRIHWLMGPLFAGAVALACDDAPTTPRAVMGPGTIMAGTGATTKASISGTIQRVGASSPERTLITPSGVCHFWGVDVFTNFTGDVQGPVTFHEQQHVQCDFSGNLRASGPIEGEVTWEGRTGMISGQFTTNCKHDPTLPPPPFSCDGIINARGSGNLEGVHFHFRWGPGWFPFPYEGTAFSK